MADPNTPKEVFDMMADRFKPDAAEGVDAIFQYEISGDNGGDWHVIVKDKSCEVVEGKHDAPSVTLMLADNDYMSMIRGELNGMQAYMSGKLKATGNIMLAQKFQQMFQV